MREGSRRVSPQPDYDELSVDAGSDLENKESSAPSACLSWLRIIREYTHTAAAAAAAAATVGYRVGLGCLVEKKHK